MQRCRNFPSLTSGWIPLHSQATKAKAKLVRQKIDRATLYETDVENTPWLTIPGNRNGTNGSPTTEPSCCCLPGNRREMKAMQKTYSRKHWFGLGSPPEGVAPRRPICRWSSKKSARRRSTLPGKTSAGTTIKKLSPTSCQKRVVQPIRSASGNSMKRPWLPCGNFPVNNGKSSRSRFGAVKLSVKLPLPWASRKTLPLPVTATRSRRLANRWQRNKTKTH